MRAHVNVIIFIARTPLIKRQETSKATTNNNLSLTGSVQTVIHKDDSAHPIFIKLCSDKAAYETRTTRRLTLNMSEAKRAIEQSKEHKILVYTPHMLILRSQKAETTLSKDGRMLIKRVSSESEAADVARQILQIVVKTAFKP